MDRLKDKVAIVTGAAKGLGEADARLFAREGARVILTDVDVANGERVAREIGAHAEFIRQDVRREEEWKQLIANVVRKYGHLDILVNNAGVVEVNTPESITEEQYRFIMAVSVDGTVFGCKHAIAAMKQTGGGSIINMASVASISGEYYVAAYCAAKGAVEAYSRAVAVHCAQNQYKIRCNSVHPAGMDTPMVQGMPAKVEAAHLPTLTDTDSTAALNPLGRAEDVANLILFLASDESSFVSGQPIVIDNTATITMGSVPGGGSLASKATPSN